MRVLTRCSRCVSILARVEQDILLLYMLDFSYLNSPKIRHQPWRGQNGRCFLYVCYLHRPRALLLVDTIITFLIHTIVNVNSARVHIHPHGIQKSRSSSRKHYQQEAASPACASFVTIVPVLYKTNHCRVVEVHCCGNIMAPCVNLVLQRRDGARF